MSGPDTSTSPVRKHDRLTQIDQMRRIRIADAIDAACWEARRYGHDDNGLHDPVDIHGEAVDPETAEYSYHPITIRVLEIIMREFDS